MATSTPERASTMLPLSTEPDPDRPGKTRPRMIKMWKPTEGQIFVITRLPERVETRMIDGLELFGDILEALIADPADRRFAERGVVKGTIDLQEYLELLMALLTAFGEADTPAPRTGPVKRASRAVRR